MTVFLIALFGGLGGLSRYLISLNVPNVWGFPIATLLINLVGSFVLPIWNNHWGLKFDNKWHVAIGTGFIGAFTTFSGVVIDLIKMNLTHNYSGLIAYLILSIVGGLLAAMLGIQLANKVRKGAE
ncbi:CrcB family protein [Lactobacillus sp. YT155]|uniref:fluoride efflux transporter FluC n=1 Tax=Lactobacillus sp. YT155 TaxID=3060955 RepID=UPI00265ED385|nr:CrcB family protein [Lactobacillus sp. YT155]MDO1604740.1 CrcB family protein [Lactobacillus sp. YT155]